MGRQPIFDQPTCLHRPGKVAAGTLGERFFQTPVLVIYVDGLPIGRQHVLCALGVDPQGYKQVLGLAPGASENPTVVQYLLDGRLRRGLDPKVRRRLVIDGAKRRGPGLMRCLARMLWCSVAGSTRYATSWPICPKNNTIKPRRRCGRTLSRQGATRRLASWTPRSAKSDPNHCPVGWNAKDDRRRRGARGKTLRKCSRSTSWACRSHGAAVCARPTCWILLMRGCVKKNGM